MLQGVGQHRFHGFVRDIHGAAHFHHFLLSGFCIAGQHMQDAIRVYFKLNPDPRHALGRGFKFYFEFPQLPVVARHLPFPLQHLDRHGRLIDHRGGEHLSRLRRNRRVARDNHVHQTPECFNA